VSYDKKNKCSRFISGPSYVKSKKRFLKFNVFYTFLGPNVMKFSTRMLSVHRASYANAEHTLTNCMRMPSIRVKIVQIVSVCSAYVYDLYDSDVFFYYAYTEHMHTIHKRMLSIRIQFVNVCSVYVYNLYAYARLTTIFEKVEY